MRYPSSFLICAAENKISSTIMFSLSNEIGIVTYWKIILSYNIRLHTPVTKSLRKIMYTQLSNTDVLHGLKLYCISQGGACKKWAACTIKQQETV